MAFLDSEVLALLAGAQVAPSRRPDVPRTPEKMPEHVKRVLESLGHLDRETGASSKAQIRRCPKCRRPIFLAWPEGSTVVRADTKPLTAEGEMWATIAGRWTYSLKSRDLTPGNLYLIHREAGTIAYHPAGDPTLDVLVAHDCTDELEGLPRMASVFDRRLHQPLPENPPF